MNDAGALVTRPFLAFELSYFPGLKLLNVCNRRWLGGRLAQTVTGHAAFAKPLAACSSVGGDQAQWYVVHVKTRAHRSIEQP